MDAPTERFLSCDWGTTSFRLRWVEGPDLAVTRELRTEDGARVIHARLMEQGLASNPVARAAAFSKVLSDGIRTLGTGSAADSTSALGTAPVIISGMASSSVGWKELPYAVTPCALDGSDVRMERVESVGVSGSTQPVWMISGVSTGSDMMRGEETELLGVMALPECASLRRGCVVILPGTHSKHVRLRGGAIVEFRTFMTGELLEVLSTKSLLGVSVAWPPPRIEGDDRARLETEFRGGVQLARDAGLAAGLFQVRARSVLNRVGVGDNAWFLAGLLVGSEILDLLAWEKGGSILLACPGPLAETYRMGFEALGATGRMVRVAPERLMEATVRAHAMLLERVSR